MTTQPDTYPIRDETARGIVPDAWLVWDDNDYYGPHLQAVCRTRDDAVRLIVDGDPHFGKRDQRYRLMNWYVEGETFR